MLVTKSSRHSFALKRIHNEEVAGLAFTKSERDYYNILSDGNELDPNETAHTAKSHIRDD